MQYIKINFILNSLCYEIRLFNNTFIRILMKILITGSCGFIGFNLSEFLLNKNFKVVGIDNLNNYYDVKINTEGLKY